METKAWYYFAAEDRNYTASYYFQAVSKEEAQAKARILYGSHDPLYGEGLVLIDETKESFHTSTIHYLRTLGEDDFDVYVKKQKATIPYMIEALRPYL